MEEADQKRPAPKTELPEDAEMREEVPQREDALIARPNSWSVFGRPARRLFRVNCKD